jgi:hypothetical protein
MSIGWGGSLDDPRPADPAKMEIAVRVATWERPQRRWLAWSAGAGDRALSGHGEAALFPR